MRRLEEAEEHQVDKIAHTLLDSEKWLGVVLVALQALCTWVVLVLSIVRGNFRKMPMQVKGTLIFMALFYPCQLGFYLGPWGSLGNRIMDSIALQQSVWTCIHWQFTYFYIELAMLFKLIYQAHCDADIEKVNKRKHKLRWLWASGYVLIALFLIAFVSIVELCSFKDEILFIIWNAQMSFIEIVMINLTLLSMRHINISSEKIQNIGVAND